MEPQLIHLASPLVHPNLHTTDPTVEHNKQILSAVYLESRMIYPVSMILRNTVIAELYTVFLSWISENSLFITNTTPHNISVLSS